MDLNLQYMDHKIKLIMSKLYDTKPCNNCGKSALKRDL